MPTGELLLVVGPSGSGKSTLLSILAGLLTAGSPRVIIGDEPASSVDTKSASLVLDVLRSFVNTERSVVLATHDPRLRAIATRIVTLEDGAVVAGETPGERFFDDREADWIGGKQSSLPFTRAEIDARAVERRRLSASRPLAGPTSARGDSVPDGARTRPR